ncbi:MAG TPA: response regulator [Hyphomicrobiaceae bacterium]|nr:response regulator [Hyphomicrobiaceae bacterium]
MTSGITVHLIDDDTAILDSLGLYLESKGFTVERHSRAQPFARLAASTLDQACIVSDVRMPGMSGIDLQQHLNQRGVTAPLILITGHGDIDMAVAAIKAGAHDFLEKPFDERRLVASIKAAMAAHAGRQQQSQALADLRASYSELSERQQQVMDLAVKGRTNKEIGATLGISPRTVEIYRAKVMERMGAYTLADLVRIALVIAERH